MPSPSNPQSLNRFAYTRNNPLKYIDPSGHRETDGCDYEGCSAAQWDMDRAIGNAERAKSTKFYVDCANGGGEKCNTMRAVGDLVLLGTTILLEPVDTVTSAISCVGGDGWSCAAALVPGLTGAGGKALSGVFKAADDVPLGAIDESVNAVAGQSLIDDVVQTDLKKVKLTKYPQYSAEVPDIAYGDAFKNKFSRIGPNAIKAGRGETLKTIIHEEMHHRLWARDTFQNEEYIRAVEQRFARLKGY